MGADALAELMMQGRRVDETRQEGQYPRRYGAQNSRCPPPRVPEPNWPTAYLVGHNQPILAEIRPYSVHMTGGPESADHQCFRAD